MSHPLDRTFAALADPTRRALIHQLRAGAATVSELAAPFDFSLAAISKHLRVLEGAGLIHREVKGREHHCSLDATPLAAATDYTAEYVQYWEERLDSLEDYLREKGSKPSSKTRRKGRRKR
jgi:DNA-binding transcriptional ArsR family regulator